MLAFPAKCLLNTNGSISDHGLRQSDLLSSFSSLQLFDLMSAGIYQQKGCMFLFC